tara:strand:- start:415 stop:555 length:141 start_codon:yes stop_codon:yes gene_type:complete
MRKLTLSLLLLIVVGVAAGAVFLATWDIPPPTSKVEKVVPDDRFRP